MGIGIAVALAEVYSMDQSMVVERFFDSVVIGEEGGMGVLSLFLEISGIYWCLWVGQLFSVSRHP